MIYEPSDDSFLLERHIKDYARKGMAVLDMGTGSGVLAYEASRHCDNVVAVDINPEAISYCMGKYAGRGIVFRESDMFNAVPEKFDLIIFNPPYLPEDPSEPEDSRRATTGGKKGYEVTERFLKEAVGHLNPDGVILLLISSLTGKKKIEEVCNRLGMKTKEIDRKKLFFEQLIVYEIKKDDIQ